MSFKKAWVGLYSEKLFIAIINPHHPLSNLIHDIAIVNFARYFLTTRLRKDL